MRVSCHKALSDSGAFVTISHFQAAEILKARGQSSVETSSDLGMSRCVVDLEEDGAGFPNGVFVHWDEIEEIADSKTKCYQVTDEGPAEIQLFSETTGLMRTLYPTRGAPTTLVSGVLMHRIKDVDPMQDTKNKLSAIAPVAGEVLDTTTGLGYTALLASKSAEHVTTVEIDPAAHEIIRANPWSEELFESPKVTAVIGDIVEIIDSLPANKFSRIIHDPPTISLAGDLYSEAFYAKLLRVLKLKGMFFHYIGDPESAHGRKITPGVIRRLYAAGFGRVERAPKAFGVVGYKLPRSRR